MSRPESQRSLKSASETTLNEDFESDIDEKASNLDEKANNPKGKYQGPPTPTAAPKIPFSVGPKQNFTSYYVNTPNGFMLYALRDEPKTSEKKGRVARIAHRLAAPFREYRAVRQATDHIIAARRQIDDFRIRGPEAYRDITGSRIMNGPSCIVLSLKPLKESRRL